MLGRGDASDPHPSSSRLARSARAISTAHSGIYRSRKVVWEEEKNCPLGRLKSGSSKVPSVRGRFWGPTPASRTLTQEPPGWYVLLSYVQMRYKGLREKSGDVGTCRTALCGRPFKTVNTQLQDPANVQRQ